MAKRLHEITEQVMQMLNNLVRQDLSSSSSSTQVVDEHVAAEEDEDVVMDEVADEVISKQWRRCPAAPS